MAFPSLQAEPWHGTHAWQPQAEGDALSLTARAVGETALPDHAPGLLRRVLQGGAWVIAGRLGGIAATLLVNVILARSLTPAEFGQFVLITSVIGLASIAAMCGVNGSVMRYITESIGRQDARLGRDAFRLGVRVALVSAPCVAVATALVALCWRRESPAFAAIIPLAVALLFMAWQQIAAEALRAMQEHKLANLFSGGQGGGVVTITLFVVLFLAGSLAGRPSLGMALWMYAAAPVVTLPVTMYYVHAAIQAKLPLASGGLCGESKAIGIRQFLNLSGSLLLIQLLVYVSSQADLWFVGSVLSATAMARYAAARRILMVMVMPLQLVNLTIVPSIGELYAAGRREKLQQVLRASSTTAFVIACAALVLVVIGGERLVWLLFGPWYQDGIRVLLVLCLGQLVVAWCGSSGYVLVMTGRQNIELSITVASFVLLLVLAPTAASFYGETGIAAAVSIAAAVKGVCQWWAVRASLGINAYPDFAFLAGPLRQLWIHRLRTSRG